VKNYEKGKRSKWGTWFIYFNISIGFEMKIYKKIRLVEVKMRKISNIENEKEQTQTFSR